MPDNLLELHSVIASLSAVLALALVVDVRNDARTWSHGSWRRRDRVPLAVLHLVTLLLIFVALVTSLTALRMQDPREWVTALALNTALGAFGALVIGVVVGQAVTAFRGDKA